LVLGFGVLILLRDSRKQSLRLVANLYSDKWWSCLKPWKVHLILWIGGNIGSLAFLTRLTKFFCNFLLNLCHSTSWSSDENQFNSRQKHQQCTQSSFSGSLNRFEHLPVMFMKTIIVYLEEEKFN
jgi:hypothetical protein